MTVVWAGSEALLVGLINGAYSPAANHWRRIASGGLGSPAVTVWTGRQVLMWGGGCCGDDVAAGAAYTPKTDRWEQLPASPLPGRQETVGAWTGTELVIVGGNNADGKVHADAAAYNPATHAWRRLPAMPAPRTGATATWNGTEVLVVGGRGAGGRGELHGDGVAYDPAANRWSPLPRSPLRGRFGHVAVWTGTRMLIWGGHPARQTDPERPFTDGAAYTPYPL
jgi:N-acetylneuraminic acid mutarotase